MRSSGPRERQASAPRCPLNADVRAQFVKRRARYIAIGVVAAGVAAYFAIKAVDRLNDPGRVAYMLNIPRPPSSMRVFDCASCCPTDVVITCAIEVDPKEFPLLLRGYAFSQSAA